jgi:hypothetical protein
VKAAIAAHGRHAPDDSLMPKKFSPIMGKHFNYSWYQQRLYLKKAQAWHRW